MSLVTVLVNHRCGHCVRAVDTVHRLASRTGATVAAVDLIAHPEFAKRLQLSRSPAVLFGEEIAFPGVPDEETFEALTRAG